MTTDTTGINEMRLLQPVCYARLLGEIAERKMHLGKQLFHLLIDPPADNPHLGGIPKPVALPLNFVLLVGPMNEIVTRLTQGDEIIRAIPTRLS